MTTEHSGRNAKGQFTFGNPGKQVGTRGKISKNAIQTANANWPTIIDKLVEQSLTGCTQSIKLLAAVTLPSNTPVQLDPSPEGLIAAIENGDLSALEMRQIAATVGKLQDLKELTVIRARLAELEAILDDD